MQGRKTYINGVRVFGGQLDEVQYARYTTNSRLLRELTESMKEKGIRLDEIELRNGIFVNYDEIEVLGLNPTLVRALQMKAEIMDVRELQWNVIQYGSICGVGEKITQIIALFRQIGAKYQLEGAERMYYAVYRIEPKTLKLDELVQFPAEIDERLLGFIDALDEKTARMLRDRYWGGKTRNQLAHIYSKNTEWMRRMEMRALEKLRRPEVLEVFGASRKEMAQAVNQKELLMQNGDLTLMQMDLSTRACDTLSGVGIKTYQDLTRFLIAKPKGALLDIQGFGRNAAEEVQQKLMELGGVAAAKRVFKER